MRSADAFPLIKMVRFFCCSVLESFLTLLHVNQVDRCLDIIIQALKKRPAELKYNHYPVYRDLLFFALSALTRDQINISEFLSSFKNCLF